jgi:lipid-binding SYLF domain-containing protein
VVLFSTGFARSRPDKSLKEPTGALVINQRGENMKLSKLIYLILALSLILAVSQTAWAQTKTAKQGANKAKTAAGMPDGVVDDANKQAEKASVVFKEIMDTPDKGIPKNLLDRAHCVAVFPSVIKVGFVIGGRGGRGVASCRTATGWSAPAYFDLKGGSFGLQIGAEATDFVLLFMNERAMQSLLKSKFTLGGEASVSAGPIGRTTSAETDALLTAQVLSYSRSKGVFGGLELKGTTITLDKSDMKEAYGGEKSAKEVLTMNHENAPAPIRVFPETLASYSGVGAKANK